MRLADTALPGAPRLTRARLAIRGAVQGVGFRPFLFLLAEELGLTGTARNTPQGVTVEAEGPEDAVHRFVTRLAAERPVHAILQGLETTWLEPAGHRDFRILPSTGQGETTAVVQPDIATCPACLAELWDPGNRRYRHPFLNCTHCGPRFSILYELPYDRPNTAMASFPLCEACRREYEDPRDRRFHAQPTACPDCGPGLTLWDPAGRTLARRDEALQVAATLLAAGRILAVKGVGGFHLMVDATDAAAVRRLRRRKHRSDKPFAVMFPDLERLGEACETDEIERRVLTSPEAPIVLLRRRRRAGVGPRPTLTRLVAPGNPLVGAFLPYAPLHHLLLHDVGRPLVATSANLSEEPICIDEHEALERLDGVADGFLVHDRPIVRPLEDSVVRVVGGRELVLRRGRGYAPLPVGMPCSTGLIAVGGHLKNTVAVSDGHQVFLSPHVGDLQNPAAVQVFRGHLDDLCHLYRVEPTRVAADLHPDYASTRHAQDTAWPCTQVQHHHAHVASCMAEQELTGTVLGVAWDGSGYGPDGTVWGGEFLRADERDFTRFAALWPFRLAGGEHAVREPRRCALGVLHQLFGPAALEQAERPSVDAFTPAERSVLGRMLDLGLNTPWTSSAGRLFDAVAALLDLRQRCSFEGQAAMELEFAASATGEALPFRLLEGAAPTGRVPREHRPFQPRFWVDWRPALRALLEQHAAGVPVARLAASFHETLAHMVLAVAERSGQERVVLSGGCFQNQRLTERVVALLEAASLRVYRHQRIPPNDGGIALGQALVVASGPPD